ncbi:unnamed protein product [Coffea canephora]|uniref:Alpha/beta hydrolase fold-3 domain-containing protein n=1 Tax=Coffea canephora TaxID=49390 RepID=A0A068TZG1_COFCA|nr:unnamed protein product [Coffea canephora]
MATNSTEILHDLSPTIRVYKDSRVEGIVGKDIVAASVDPETGVDPTGYKASSSGLFPWWGLLVEYAFSPTYHAHLNTVVAEIGVITVSINYQLAPEDSFKWIASHSNGKGPEAWFRDYVDFDRVFFGRDNVGVPHPIATPIYNMALRVGLEILDGFNLDSIFLHCPYFFGKLPIRHLALCSSKIYEVDDPLLNPIMEPNLSRLGCKKVLIYVAEKDILKDRGWLYKEALEKSE